MAINKRRNRQAGGAIDVALWAASGLLVVASLALSLDPEPEIIRGLDFRDGALHLIGYGALTASLLLAAVWRPGRGEGRYPGGAGGIVVVVLALGLAIEFAQVFVPHRSGDWRDVAANGLGVGLAWWAWWSLRTIVSPAGPRP